MDFVFETMHGYGRLSLNRDRPRALRDWSVGFHHMQGLRVSMQVTKEQNYMVREGADGHNTRDVGI